MTHCSKFRQPSSALVPIVLVIDSLSGFELPIGTHFARSTSASRCTAWLAHSPAHHRLWRDPFMTVEVAQPFTGLRFSTDLISFLTDDVIFSATLRSNAQGDDSRHNAWQRAQQRAATI
jgi:hypothetical protein